MTGIAPTIGGRASPGGFAGATAAVRFAGATASGAPASGSFLVGDFVIDQTGSVYICIVAGTPGTWTAAGKSRADIKNKAAGYIAETCDLGSLRDVPGTVATSGSTSASLVGLRAGDVITSMTYYCITSAGTGLTLVKMGIATKAGVVLATTADFHASLATGINTVALTTPLTITADDGYFFCFTSVGTTGPTLVRGVVTPITVPALNGGALRFSQTAGQTDLVTFAPAAFTVGFWLAGG